VRDENGFRRAVPSDATQLVSLVRSAYRGSAGWTSEADLVGGERIDAAQVLKLITHARSMLLVLEENDGLLACCHLEDLGERLALLGTFAVRPKAQDHGVGRRMMAEAERWAAAEFGADALEITVLAQQAALILWYERLGFERTGEVRPFPVDARYARPKRDDLHFVVLRKKVLGDEQAAR
jgi:N-acetylglutamate synthase-like GNAT family acetyltransferase